MNDLRYCARMLRRSPGLVAACVLSLGLGLGATTAVFSFVNAVQFSPLGVRDEARLVDVSETSHTDLCAYVPFAAAPGRNVAITVATDGDAAALAPDVRAAVAAADPDQPVENLMTMEAMLTRWTSTARSIALLMGSLAGVALLMAAMGTFGVVACSVSRRRREIGVRLALGATPGEVQRMMAGLGVRLALAGLALGFPAAWLSTRTLEGALAGTSPTDTGVFATVAIGLAAVTLLASWLPSRRAARIDPLIVLRQE